MGSIHHSYEHLSWLLEQISTANKHHFTLLLDGKEDRRENPLRQAKNYFALIVGKIKKDGQLVSRDSHFYGNVKIPVNCGVVFPNINKYEYQRHDLEDVIHPDRIFFWDDLHPQSPICSDPT